MKTYLINAQTIVLALFALCALAPVEWARQKVVDKARRKRTSKLIIGGASLCCLAAFLATAYGDDAAPPDMVDNVVSEKVSFEADRLEDEWNVRKQNESEDGKQRDEERGKEIRISVRLDAEALEKINEKIDAVEAKLEKTLSDNHEEAKEKLENWFKDWRVEAGIWSVCSVVVFCMLMCLIGFIDNYVTKRLSKSK